MDNFHKKVIFMSHIRDESVYFYNWIDFNTIIIVLNNPTHQEYENIFQEFVRTRGCHVFRLGENSNFCKDYKLSTKSKNVIDTMLDTYNDQGTIVLTHPKYTKKSDPQNRAIYDYINSKKLPNHYVYSYNKYTTSLTDDQRIFLMKYCLIYKDDDIKLKQLNNYVHIAEKIGSIKCQQ